MEEFHVFCFSSRNTMDHFNTLRNDSPSPTRTVCFGMVCCFTPLQFSADSPKLVASAKQFVPVDLCQKTYTFPVFFVDATRFCLEEPDSHGEVLGEVLGCLDDSDLQKVAGHLDLELQHFAIWDKTGLKI